jgi:hypothetical protein
VQLLGGKQEVVGQIWVEILVVEDGRQGWILQDLLQMATPEPIW